MKKLKIKIGKRNFFIPNILILLTLGLIVRICLAWFGTLKLDQGTFIAWSNLLAKNGFKNFYQGWSDYLPGYLYILWFLGKIRGILPDVLLYKLPAILADLGTGYLVWQIVKNKKWGILAAGLYIFNPAVLANSTFWGQTDSLTALFSLLSIYLLTINSQLSAISLAIGVLIKPQAAFIAPVILFLMLKEKWSFRKVFVYLFIGLFVYLLGFLPFAGGQNLISFMISRLILSAGQYPYTSVNAFNFWGLFGFWQPDKQPVYLLTGILISLAVFVLVVVKKRKEREFIYFAASLLFLTTFLFLTRMHERHLLPVLAPLAVSAVFNPPLWVAYFGLSLTYLANLVYAHQWVTYDFLEVFSPALTKLFSFINLGLFAFVILTVFKRIKLKIPKIEVKPMKLTPWPIKTSTKKLILIGILVFSFLTRVAWLNNPKNEYFDEVYHAFTAKLVLHADSKAWEWWNPHPEGFAYEWTHPPLAKLGMALGMKIFGENSFGWRIPGALLGVGSVFLVFAIAKVLFKDDLISLLSAGIFSLDGLPLVMARIGMNDSYLLFFALLTIYCFLKEKNFWSALSFGLALASKWSAIWVIPILGVIWLSKVRKFNLSYLWFLILPFGFYLLSYFQMFTTGHNLGTWWGMQKQMWWYHTNLRATHPYTSPWWQWPLLIRPIYLYTSDEIKGFVARIYALGNPVVFWFGLVSVVTAAIFAFAERNKKLGFVIFCYLVFFVPWAASPRIMFLYHYLPSIPFLSILIAYVLRRNSKLIIGLLAIGLLVFIYFYPHWAGLRIPLWLDTSYYWFPTWR